MRVPARSVVFGRATRDLGHIPKKTSPVTVFSKESLELPLKNHNTLQRVPNANLNIDQKSYEQQPQNHQTYTNADRDRKQRTSTGDRETVYENRTLQYNLLEFVPDTIPILLLTSTKININKCARTAPETYQKSYPNLSKIDPKRDQNRPQNVTFGGPGDVFFPYPIRNSKV